MGLIMETLYYVDVNGNYLGGFCGDTGLLPDTAVEVPERPSGDHVWNNGDWEMDAAVVKIGQIKQINDDRATALQSGVVHNGKRYHTDDTFLGELNMMLTGYAVGAIPSGATQNIRTMDNETLSCAQAEIVAIALAVGSYRKQVYADAWAAKDAIDPTGEYGEPMYARGSLMTG